MSQEEESGHVDYLTEWPPPPTKAAKVDGGDNPSKDGAADEILRLERLETGSASMSDLRDVVSLDCDAKTTLAKHMRRERRRRGAEKGGVRFNSYRKSEEGRRFFASAVAHLLRTRAKSCIADSQADYTVATFYDELGDYERALEHLQSSARGYKVDLDKLDSCGHSDFLNAISELEEEAKECLWYREKVRLSLETSGDKEVFPSKVQKRQVTRVKCEDLSVDDFRKRYVAAGVPVVVTGVDVGGVWDLETVSTSAADKKVPLKRMHEDSTDWAKLENSEKEMTVRELLETEGGSGLYLFDWSLPLFCPELRAKFTMPTYFEHNYLTRTSPDALYRNSWPSLFLATANDVSGGLHVDAFASHFWMFLMQGSKRWTIYDRDALEQLHPKYVDSLDPTFDIDDARGRCGHVEVVLEPGELLFVPSGSPHRVENLGPTLAVSGNFADETNVCEVARHLRRNALVDPRAGDLLAELLALGLVEG